MRKENPVRYSSAVGEAWMHAMFKVKYCHPIFDDELYREGMHTLLLEAAYEYGIELGVMGFDNNHAHFMVDVGMYKREGIRRRSFLSSFQSSNARRMRVGCSGILVCGIPRITWALQRTWNIPSVTLRSRSTAR